MLLWQKDDFFHTSFEGGGITDELADSVIAHLNAEASQNLPSPTRDTMNCGLKEGTHMRSPLQVTCVLSILLDVVPLVVQLTSKAVCY
ncbi:hypothetical protein [Bradyrhizobium sp. SZCCHNS2005]|uniref:hypothetical protein n=1 Tax=Bradyrhizobium sp. SZCCHNS2005 TaxID=3057303 RepID=UPI0028E5FA30|nr:hypothetical protein [Bradyrhizobium sp. SZCCHNS2005]